MSWESVAEGHDARRPVATEWTVVDSAIGPLLLVATPVGLALVGMHASGRAVDAQLDRVAARLEEQPRPWGAAGSPSGAVLAAAVAELERYFAGELRRFGVPLDWTLVPGYANGGGGAAPSVAESTDNYAPPGAVRREGHALSGFTERVLRTLAASVPYGSVVGYRELAARAGAPGAARAVGAAMGANPLPLVVACHRVVAADGGIGGFGGGLETKRALLALEGVLPAPLF